MLGYDYIIGDPIIREKIRDGFRFAAKCVVIALACIGLGALLATICQICAW